MTRRKQRALLDGLDDFMLGTLVCSAVVGISLLAFFFFKAVVTSPYAVITLTLLAGAFLCFGIILVVSIFSR